MLTIKINFFNCDISFFEIKYKLKINVKIIFLKYPIIYKPEPKIKILSELVRY